MKTSRSSSESAPCHRSVVEPKVARRRLLTGGASGAALLSVVSTPVMGASCVTASRLMSMHASAAHRPDTGGTCVSTPASVVIEPFLFEIARLIEDESKTKKEKVKKGAAECEEAAIITWKNSPNPSANSNAFKTFVDEACKKKGQELKDEAESFEKRADAALANLRAKKAGALAALKGVDPTIAKHIQTYNDQYWTNGLTPETPFSQVIGLLEGIGDAPLLEVMMRVTKGPYAELAALLATALVNLRSGQASIPDIVLNETKIRTIAGEFAAKMHFEPTAGIQWDAAKTVAWLTQPPSMSGMPMRGVGLRLQA